MDLPGDSITYNALRELLLARKDRKARVDRELWTCNQATFEAYRKYLMVARASGGPAEEPPPPPSSRPSRAVNVLGSPEFSFQGCQHVVRESSSAVTVLSFGKLSVELLAFGNEEGDLWIVRLADDDATVHKAVHVHEDKVTGLDWCYDNSYLLSCSLCGRVCVWDSATGACVRRLQVGGFAAFCCRFHMVNFNIFMVGTTNGTAEVYNSNTGVVVRKAKVPGASKQTAVTGIALSSTQAFLGDSRGMLHALRCEVSVHGVSTLTHINKVKVVGTAPSPVGHVHYLQFATAAKGPIVLTSALDSVVCLLRVAEGGRVEVLQRVVLPDVRRRVNTLLCPSSAQRGAVYVASGGEDAAVHVYGLAADSHPRVKAKLEGHDAPVVDVSWTFDESRLASADAQGTVLVWQRQFDP